MPIIALAIILAACWYVWVRPGDNGQPRSNADWVTAAGDADGPIDKLLLSAAKPLRGNEVIYDRAMSPAYKSIQSKLLASGGLYAGSVEVFLSVQLAGVILGAVMIAAAMSFELDGMTRNAVVVLAAAVTGWPWGQLNKVSKERVREINATLPAFADLLQMPLSAGMGVLPAISFTTDRLKDGLVKHELENMLALQKSRAVSDAQAFMMAGERLGTPEAKSFFTALMQAHTQGMKVVENLEKQAEGLRDKAFEQRRAEIMRIPAKISVKTTIHFMPGLLMVVFLPVMLSFGNM